MVVEDARNLWQKLGTFCLTTSADGAPLALLNHAIHLAQLDQEDQHLCAGRNECHIDAADSA
jgi:hypothetical protein